MKENGRISETLQIALLMTFAGGYLDAYTYLMRGHVFATAQTGNLVLLSISLFEMRFADSFRYIVSAVSFFLGVLATEAVRSRFRPHPWFFWRQIVIAIECAGIAAAVFIPESCNLAANSIIAFICALQLEAFRKLHGNSYSTTVLTGNLRSAAEHFYKASGPEGSADSLHSSRDYFYVIAVFCLGVGASAAASRILGLYSALAALIPLVCAAVIISAKGRKTV